MSRIHCRRFYGIFLVLLTVLCWTSSIPTQFLQIHPSVLPSSSASRDKGWEKVWNGGYLLRHIWGDSSHLFIGAQGGDQVYPTNKMQIQKWDLHGNWLKNFSWEPQVVYSEITGIWGNIESICVTGFEIEEVMESEEEFRIIYGFIKKFDKNLNLQWDRTWDITLNATFTDIWCNEQYIFAVSFVSINNSTWGIALTKWDMNGDLIWNSTISQFVNYHDITQYNYYEYWYYRGNLRVMGNSDSIYIDHMRNTNLGYIESLSKWNFNGTNVWNQTTTLDGWNGYIRGDMWVGENLLYKVHEFHGVDMEFCPYKEDLALQKWDTDGNMIWQKNKLSNHAYSEGDEIPCTKIWGNGTDVYLCTDKFRERILGGATDLYLLHFNKNGDILEEKTWHYGHQLKVISILLWGNNESLYSGGEIRIKADFLDSIAELEKIKFLIQWSEEPNVPLIVGLSVGGVILFMIPISLLIFKRRQLKKIDTNSAQK